MGVALYLGSKDIWSLMRLPHMLFGHRRLGALGTILVGALMSTPAIVRAQAAADRSRAAGSPVGSPVGSPAGLASERQKLRTELERVNGEIDALKRDKRGLGDDYRLRARMADAESLARRLTELDARMRGANRTGANQAGAAWPSAPEARPSDDRADLEAKADILSDQARRLDGQASVLAERVTALRGRQELRRRAGQLERDPFSPLEQVKRRTATAGGTAAPSPGANAGFTKTETGGPASPGQTTIGGQMPAAGGPTATPPTTPGTTGVTGVTGGAAADQAARSGASSTTGLNAPPAAIPLGAAAIDSPGSVASQFRGILDPATLAEIRRLEVPGSPGGSLQAMERALSALRARAAQLGANASALRAQARTAR